jgi:hypothetical protein
MDAGLALLHEVKNPASIPASASRDPSLAPGMTRGENSALRPEPKIEK